MRSLLLIAAISAAIGVMAQNTLFRSYSEYVGKGGESVEGPIDVVPHWGRFMVVFEKERQKERIPTRKIWGFLNDGFLYRIEQEGHLPVRLMAQGAIMYWENGLAHLHIQHDSTGAAHFGYGYAAYLSRDLQGPIVPAVFKPGDTKSASAKFKATWPAYGTLLVNIGEGTDMDRVRQLVVDYEVAVEEGRITGP